MSNGTSITGGGGTTRKAASGKAFGGTATGWLWRSQTDSRLPQADLAHDGNVHDGAL